MKPRVLCSSVRMKRQGISRSLPTIFVEGQERMAQSGLPSKDICGGDDNVAKYF